MPAGRLIHEAPAMPFVPPQSCRSPSAVPGRSARALAVIAGLATLVGACAIVALHLLPASRGLDPLAEPLSGYAFAPDGWLFDLGVSALALGLAVLVSALVRGGCIAGRTPACALLCVCSLSLVLVVLFREHDASGAVTTAGRVHWVASMLSFGGLTLAPTLCGRRPHQAFSGCSRLTSAARWLSVGSGPCFVMLLVGSLLRYSTPIAVVASYFGLGERALVGVELAIAGVLIVWAWRGCVCGEGTCRSSATPCDSVEPSSHSARDGSCAPARQRMRVAGATCRPVKAKRSRQPIRETCSSAICRSVAARSPPMWHAESTS